MTKHIIVHRVDTHSEGPDFPYPHSYFCSSCGSNVSRANFITSYTLLDSSKPKLKSSFVYSVKQWCRDCRDKSPR